MPNEQLIKQFTKMSEHFLLLAAGSARQLGHMSGYNIAISTFHQIWPHLQRNWSWITTNCSTPSVAELCLRYVRGVAPLLLSRGQVETVRAWCQTASKACPAIDDASRAALVYYEASVYMKYKQMHEAKSLLEKAREYFIAHEDADNPNLYDVLTSLGIVCFNVGSEAEAEKLFEEASLFLLRRTFAIHPYSALSFQQGLQTEAFERNFSASGVMARFVQSNTAADLWSDRAGLIEPPTDGEE